MTAKGIRQIQKQAALYVARLYSGELSEAEEAAIIAWCKASPYHQLEYQKALAIWDNSSALPRFSEQTPRRQRIKAVLAVAACTLLAATLSISYLHSSTKPKPDSALINPLQRQYQTVIGQVSTVTLPDGSELTLNTATTVRIDFTGKERQVWLQSGEAFFDVAKDPERPFSINTGMQTIRVLGTQFNVRKSADSIQVAVTEGIVSVHNNAKTAANNAPWQDAYLPAGSVAAFSDSSKVVSNNQPFKANSAQSWRTGIFRFDDESLANVVAEFNRYRHQKLVIEDPQAADLKISGVFHLKDGDSLINALKATLPIKVDHKNGQYRIYLDRNS